MVQYNPNNVRLKDGRLARIREVSITDAVDLLTLTHAVVADGRGIVCAYEDVPQSLSEMRTSLYPYLEGHRSGAYGIRLVVELCDDSRCIVATAVVYRMSASLLRHVAVLGVEVHPDYQGQGLGRALMNSLVDWARHSGGRLNGGVNRLELGVRADNYRAVQLYRSMGFEVESVRKRFVRLSTGHFVDELVMTRFLPLHYEERWGDNRPHGHRDKSPRLRLLPKSA